MYTVHVCTYRGPGTYHAYVVVVLRRIIENLSYYPWYYYVYKLLFHSLLNMREQKGGGARNRCSCLKLNAAAKMFLCKTK